MEKEVKCVLLIKMIEYIFATIVQHKVKIMRVSTYTGLMTTPLLLYNTILLIQFSLFTTILIIFISIILFIIIAVIDDIYIYPRELKHIYNKSPQINEILNNQKLIIEELKKCKETSKRY